jgi:multicomponent Na+:H+ antiporter subunit E
MITLTPGTLSLEVSSDRRVLYVHNFVVDDPEEFRQEIKNGFEQRVLEVTG